MNACDGFMSTCERTATQHTTNKNHNYVLVITWHMGSREFVVLLQSVGSSIQPLMKTRYACFS